MIILQQYSSTVHACVLWPAWYVWQAPSSQQSSSVCLGRKRKGLDFIEKAWSSALHTLFSFS